MRNKTVFSVGMEVWDMLTSIEKGVVKTIKPKGDTPIVVYFGDIVQYYTLDGRHAINQPKVLSTKKYDLVKGGFSQELPKLEVKEWKTLFVWDQHIRRIGDQCGPFDFKSDESIEISGYRRSNISFIDSSPFSREAKAIEILRDVIYAGVKLPSIANKVKSFIEEIDSYKH